MAHYRLWGIVLFLIILAYPAIAGSTETTTNTSVSLNNVSPQDTIGLSPASASFSINADEEATTEADSISSGIHLVQYWGDISISNIADDSKTVLGNITVEVDAENITSVDRVDEPEFIITWNRTHAKWIFPRDLVINETKYSPTWWKTDYYYSHYIPMSMKRSINQTIFASDGYQLVNFNVTFENKACDFIQGKISAEQSPLNYVDATLLNETFATDAPIKSISTNVNTNHEFTFYLDPNLVELGKPYQFSMLIRVNVTTPDGSLVKYSPRCFIGLGNYTGSGTIGTGYTVSMPSSGLPPHANSASVTTNVSNSWSYSNSFIEKMSFKEVCRKLTKNAIGVMRNGMWYLDYTTDGSIDNSFHFGTIGDIALTGEWDGTGITNIGVFRPANGNWYLDTTKTGVVNKTFHFGRAGDISVVGDWNSDGIKDIGVFRPSNGNWYMDTTKTGVVNMMFHFGANGDIPVVGDWNGDGIKDIGIFRPANGNWYLDTTKTGIVNMMFHFGKSGDIPVIGDWNGDGITDTGVFRPSNGNWYLSTTKTGTVNMMFHFGTNGDIPVIGDWDGTGITNIGVYRPSNGNWYLDTTKTGVVNKTFHFGTNGDTPVVGKWN
jgi:hypothetical protein